MQDPKNSQARNNKPWYQRAVEMGSLWRSISNNSKSTQVPAAANSTIWKTIFNTKIITTTNHNNTPSANSNSNSNNSRHNKLRKCTSLKVATSFTRVCLCAPISSYNEVFRAELPPRRSNSYPRTRSHSSSSSGTSITQAQQAISARLSTEHQGIRRVFRGKSLMDDVLMRRFVVEEEAMMQVRRRNQMEVIRRRSVMRRRRLGPSPLSRMVMAEED